MSVRRHPPRPGAAVATYSDVRGRRECLDCTGTLYRPTPAPDRWAHFLGYTKREHPRPAPVEEPEPALVTVARGSLLHDLLVHGVVEAAIAEREAEQACKNRPWEDRAAWLAYVQALEARRAAVDALAKAVGR